MRIALYQATARLGQDGTTTTLGQMLAAMDRASITYRVFTPDPPESTGIDARRFVRLRSVRLPFYRDYCLTLPRKRSFYAGLDAFAPDLVHIGTPDFAGLAMLRWSRARGVPAVGAYHTHFPAYLPHYRLAFLNQSLWRYFRWFYGTCDATLVPTTVIATVLRAQGIDRLRDWPRGVDSERFAPDFRSQQLRQRCGVGPQGCLFAYVGRLANEKNVPLVAEAWARVRAQAPGARLLWVGDGPWRQRLEKMTPDATFTGRLRGQELSTAFASADVLIFPSQTETFGNVVLEAQASGLPVIGVAGTAVSANVRDGHSGRLLDRADPEAFSRAMLELAADPLSRMRMGQAALQHARSQHWQLVFDRQFAVYRDVLTRPQLPASGGHPPCESPSALLSPAGEA